MTRVTDRELTGQIRTRALLVLLAMLVLAPGVVGCGGDDEVAVGGDTIAN